MEKPQSVEQFIENAVPEAQPILIALRKLITETFPGIQEKIGYGVPQYKYANAGLGMSTAKKHVTLGFDYDAVSDEMRKQLTEKGYKLGLQTLQIKFTQEIPKDEIQQIFAKIKNEN